MIGCRLKSSMSKRFLDEHHACLRVFREVEGGAAGDGSSEWECFTTEEESHEMDINCVVWAPNCSLLASASDDETVKLWVLEES